MLLGHLFRATEKPTATQFMKDEYPDSKSDLFAAFIERVESLVKPDGFMAQVTMQSWMFLSSYEKLRARLQQDASIVAMLHMDNMVMRIAFRTCATIWEICGDPGRVGKYTYVEAADVAADGPRKFPPRNDRTASAGSDGYFTVSQTDFAEIPGAPTVYWLSEEMRLVFTIGDPLGAVASLAVGLQTGDNSKFLRHWWEVSLNRTEFTCTSREEAAESGARWFPYNKGGEFRKWYGNQEFVVNWENDGAEIVEFKPRSVIRNAGTYFSPSVSWSKISSGAPAFRAYPVGFIYDVAGTSIFAATGRERAGLLSFANSQVALEQLAAIAPTLNYEVGQVASLPVAEATVHDGAVLAATAIDEAKADWDLAETSWNFERNPLAALV